MAMRRRIAEIATKFKADGATAFQNAVNGIGTSFRNLGNRAAPAATAVAKSLGKVTLAAGAAAAAIAAVGKASILAFAHSSLEDTVEDLRAIRQTAGYLRTSVPMASLFQNLGRTSGIDPEGMRDILAAYNTALSEAATDAESDFAKNFERVGIRVSTPVGYDPQLGASIKKLRKEMQEAGAPTRDINLAIGEMTKQMTDFGATTEDVGTKFFQLAQQVQGMGSRDRSLFLASIFGDGDALVVSELLDRIGNDQSGVIRMIMAQAKANQIVTQRAVDLAKRIDSSRGGLAMAWLSVKRVVFTQIAPLYIRLIERVAVFLVQNTDRIGNWVSRQISSAYQLIHDAAKVLFSFDLNRFLLGASAPARNLWLFKVKDVLDDIWAAIKRIPAAARDLRRVFEYATGASPARKVALVQGADAGRRMAASDPAAGDPGSADETGIETGLGHKLLGVKFGVDEMTYNIRQALAQQWRDAVAEFDAALVQPLKRAWANANARVTAGVPLLQVNGGLTKALYVIIKLGNALSSVAGYAERFGQAFEQVFTQQQAAPAGFAWMQDVRDGIGGLLQSLGDAARAFGTLFEGINKVLENLGLMRVQSVAVFAAMILGAGRAINLLTFGLAGVALKGVLAVIGEIVAAVVGGTGLTAAFTAWRAAAVAQIAVVGTAFASMIASVTLLVSGFFAGFAAGWYGIDALFGDTLRKRNDDATGQAVDNYIRPAMDADFDRYGKKPGERQIFDIQGMGGGGTGAIDIQSAQMQLSRMDATVSDVDLSAANVTMPASNLRPILFNIGGRQTSGQAYADADFVESMRRQASTSLGGD